MSKYNTSTSVQFWFPDKIKIGEVLSATKPEYFDLEGKTLSDFEPGQRQSLEDFRNRLLIRAENGEFMEFVEG